MSSPQIVDAHMHLWDVESHAWYPALKQMAEAINQPELYSSFGIADYRAQAGADFEVTKFVHVSGTTQPRAYLEEARWVDQVATAEGLDLAIIGTVEPSLSPEEIRADLEAQAESSRFRGARVLFDFEPDSQAAAVVLPWLSEHEMVFDLVAAPAQIPAWLEVLEQHPDLQVVLEHTGWPAGTDEAARAEWDAALQAVATRTQALCKVSGLGMTTLDLSGPTLRPWIERAVELFGWDRVAFGSNMPMERMAGSYAQWIQTVRAVIGEASADEQAWFYAGNATRVYSL